MENKIFSDESLFQVVKECFFVLALVVVVLGIILFWGGKL